MGVIHFSTQFSGGVGSLDITNHQTGNVLHFTPTTTNPQNMTLPKGTHIFTVTGVAPAGTGGNIALDVTGNIPAEIKQNFPAGVVPPHPMIIFTTI